MKKVTIITGNQGVGKTLKAREISEGKNVYETDDHLKHAVAFMPVDTDIIIIEMNFAIDILNAIKADFLSIRRPYTEKAVPVKVPDLIITTCISIDFIEQIQATEILKLTQIIK